ncbi:hypothetical protein LEN26_017045 [Aphanomyces euteiches]|nr:hypothetical protein LEN26_017045 [Aphanomyces euteiches]KAH9127930.1 hypothetical protein AeMF1_001836 [Aphanomyces euteiches]KAH9190595.1 hypothetical protein AeNC1_007429 [Aphanomyces euteiches]
MRYVAAVVAITAAGVAADYGHCKNLTLGNTCVSIREIPNWWNCVRDEAPGYLILAGAMIFFATFLPRVLLRVLLFTLGKLPFVREIVDDYVKLCTSSTTYLLSATLCMGAAMVSLLAPYLCRFHIYIWGIFFLMWIYSIFNVIDRLAVRRFGGKADNSKKVVISESIKLLRLLVLVIASMYIYLQMWQDQTLLKYSFLGMIGGAMALGFVGATHNAVGGLYLVLNAPFRVDEFIQVGSIKGHVQRVALRYTVVLALDGTKIFVPNSFFLNKPMVNYSQRPKRQLQMDIRVHPSTSVDLLETFMHDLEVMLQSRHMGLTSHEEYNGVDKSRFFFVTMEALFTIRLYTYTDELDAKKHAMIKSEVWLAAMEIMEDLGVKMQDRESNELHVDLLEDDAPFSTEFGLVTGSIF